MWSQKISLVGLGLVSGLDLLQFILATALGGLPSVWSMVN